MKIYHKSDTKITVTLKDKNSNLVSGGVVKVTLVTLSGTEVVGETWPKTLTGQGDGTYVGILPAELETRRNQRLVCRVEATYGSYDTYAEIATQVAVDKT